MIKTWKINYNLYSIFRGDASQCHQKILKLVKISWKFIFAYTIVQNLLCNFFLNIDWPSVRIFPNAIIYLTIACTNHIQEAIILQNVGLCIQLRRCYLSIYWFSIVLSCHIDLCEVFTMQGHTTTTSNVHELYLSLVWNHLRRALTS